jgi:hypothetical protein
MAEIGLPGEARSAGLARRFLAGTLTGWGRTDYAEDAALLVTELVTNAALHARTDIVVSVELTGGVLRVAVTDGSPRHPVLRHYSVESTTGRGLALVSIVASRWGTEANADGTKTVWAELGGAGSGGRDSKDPLVVEPSPFASLEESAPGPGRSPSTTYLRAA